MLTPGSLVGGYRIERTLGAGGMGTVYLAANPTLPRHDALKVLSAELSRNPDFRARFLREADVASGLDHPNIVSVYSRGQTDEGQLWIAMQFVDGDDADAALRAGTMTPWRAVHIIGCVAKALDYAHSRGVVHRDIKPANFLLSGPVGPDERVLLGDFGIARALDDVGLTATGSVLATVAYAAPEVLSGMAFDGRADIYSLGCTLYALLTGATPYPATNGPAAVMMAHLQRPAPRVTDVVPALPAGLDGVIATAMAKDPAQRFPSASAFADAARAVLADPHRRWAAPEPARPAGPPERRSRRTLLAASGAAALLLVGASVTAVAVNRQSGGGTPDTAASAALTVTADRESEAAQGPPATDVQASALRSILLTAAEIRADASGEPVVLEGDGIVLPDDADAVDDRDCVGVWAPAQERVYGSSGFAGAQVQVLRAMYRKPFEDGVVQAALAFPTQAAAIRSLQQQQKQWETCSGRSLAVTPPGEPTLVWELGRQTTVSGTVQVDVKTADGGAACQHGIGVRGNVLIDIRQCRTRGVVDVGALVYATAGKVPRR